MAHEELGTQRSGAAKARLNEEKFARANAELAAKADSMRFEMTGGFPFLCECSDAACTMLMRLSLGSYRALRATHEGAFLLLAGHEDEHVEQVVAQNDGLVIVEKYQQRESPGG